MTKEEIISAIEKMSVLELAELVKALEQRFGVSATAPVMATVSAAPVTAATAVAEPVEEKTEFDVILKEIGAKKINVIKAVRQITNLGLKEAKDLVESAPTPVLQAAPKEAAEEAKKLLEAEGATVEIR